MKVQLILWSLLVLMSCGQKQDKHIANADPGEGLPTEFESFYKQFHEDTAFQTAHIVWPLPGRKVLSDTTQSEHFWTREDWKYHTPMSADSDFDRSFEILSDYMINEKFEHRELGIQILRRFANTSDGWNLIYYSAPDN